MKIFLSAIVVVAAFSFILAGCAKQSSTTTASNTEPTKRTVTQKDLSRSTRTQPAEQLQAADPSIGR